MRTGAKGDISVTAAVRWTAARPPGSENRSRALDHVPRMPADTDFRTRPNINGLESPDFDLRLKLSASLLRNKLKEEKSTQLNVAVALWVLKSVHREGRGCPSRTAAWA